MSAQTDKGKSIAERLEKLDAQMKALAARRQQLAAMEKENKRKMRNAGLVAFGVCMEQIFLKDPERRKALIADIERELSGKTLERAKALLEDLEKQVSPASLAPEIATSRVYLRTEYDEREAVKAIGARWDPDRKQWYMPEGSDLSKAKPEWR